MAISFPSSPSLNQTYTVGSKTWIWNGYAWDLQIANNASVLAVAQSAYNTANNALPNVGSIITVNSSSVLYVSNTTPSTSSNTGALIVNGGLGVTGNLNVGGTTVNLSTGGGSWLSVLGGSNTGTQTVTIAAADPTGLSGNSVNMFYAAQNGGYHSFRTGAGQIEQFRVSPTSVAVNYLQATGATTTNSPGIYAQGSDTNVGLILQTKNAGPMTFTKSASSTNSAVYLFQNAGGLYSDTAGGFWRGVHSSPSLINFGGTNVFPRAAQYWESDSYTNPTYINYYNSLGNYSTANVISYIFANQTGGSFIFRGVTANSIDTSFKVVVANTVANIIHSNYLQVAGNTSGNTPILSAQGTDTNIDLNINSKGSGNVTLSTTSANSFTFKVQEDVSGTPTPGTFWLTGPKTALGRVGLKSINALFISTGSTNALYFNTNSTAATGSDGTTQLRVSATTSAVNFIDITGSVTQNHPIISAQGNDSNINITLTPKGTGKVTTSATLQAGLISGGTF